MSTRSVCHASGWQSNGILMSEREAIDLWVATLAIPEFRPLATANLRVVLPTPATALIRLPRMAAEQTHDRPPRIAPCFPFFGGLTSQESSL